MTSVQVPSSPYKKSGHPGTEGGKEINKIPERGVALFIVCRRRGFLGGRRKRKTQYSPLASTNIPFLSYPPVAGLIEEVFQNRRDDIQDPRLRGLAVTSHRQLHTEAEYLRGYASSSSEPDETSSVSETSSSVESG